MPNVKIIGLPRTKKGEKLLVIKESDKDMFIVRKLKNGKEK